MDTRKTILIVVWGAIILFGLNLVFFTVDETRLAIITQLGKYVRTVEEPGLHLRIPLLQTVHYFEKRILEYDAAPAEILTQDKKNLVVDNYARWKITDPLKFYQTVRDEASAQTRLDDIVYSELREELARHTFSEIITIHREEIMDIVAECSSEKAADYGIKIVDVRIKRADLPKEVEHSVYARMSAERSRIAKKYRSEGNEEAAKIRAEADKQRTIILAEAYRIAQQKKGEGDAEATKIYAAAFGRNPEFYDFIRTLEAYKKILSQESTVVLKSDSELFRYLSSSGK